MDCPKCLGTLETIPLTQNFSRGGKGTRDKSRTFVLEIDKCFSCGGVWFDKNELDKYLTEGMTVIDSPSLGRDLDRSLDQATGKCPRCVVELQKAPVTESKLMTIDICPECQGVWLDPTEIDRFESGSESGRDLIDVILGVFRL